MDDWLITLGHSKIFDLDVEIDKEIGNKTSLHPVFDFM